jgi:serine O-acetyltransferase
MKQKQINETLRRNVGVLSEHTEDEIRMMPTSKETPLPSVEDVKQIVSLIKGIVFPDYFDKRQPDEQLRSYQIGVSMEKLYQLLRQQIERGLQFCEECSEDDVKACGEKLALEFIDSLPEIKRLLYTDIQAMFDNDPAAATYGEVIFCYPVVNTMTH